MTADSGWDALRRVNRQGVVAAVRRLGTATRSDLEDNTGLSRATISAIIAELKDEGLVAEIGTRPVAVGRGRPSTLWRLAPPTGLALSVDIGRGHVGVLVGDVSGAAVAEQIVRFDPGLAVGGVLDLAASTVEAVAAKAGLAQSPPVAATLGLPSPVSLRGRVLARRFDGLDPVRALRLDDLAPLVRVRNDAHLGAAGEVAYGAGRGVANVIYVKMSHGLGAGLVLGGSLYRGDGQAGSLGHVRVRDDGDVCICGNRGCLETLVSAETLVRALQPGHPDREVTVPDLLRLVTEGDAGACGLVADAGRTVGRTLAEITTVVNPSAVVVGGELGALGGPLLGGLRESLSRYGLPRAVRDLVVTSARCGRRAELLGGLALAFGLVGEVGDRTPAGEALASFM